MIDVPASFRAMPRWWADGSGWLDALPGLVAAQCERWDLTPDGVVRHGSNALVVRVRRGDDRLALRLSPPGDDVTTESAALRFWDGRGTVRLHDLDTVHRAQLLEWVTPGDTAERLPLAATAAIVGGVVRRLAVEAPLDVRSTGDVVAADRADWSRRWSALGRPTPTAVLTSALDAADAVRVPLTPRAAVNADLHLGQILRRAATPATTWLGCCGAASTSCPTRTGSAATWPPWWRRRSSTWHGRSAWSWCGPCRTCCGVWNGD